MYYIIFNNNSIIIFNIYYSIIYWRSIVFISIYCIKNESLYIYINNYTSLIYMYIHVF